MLESFLYSVNTILPIFLIVIVGWLIKRFGFLSERFFEEGDKLVFRLALPALLFLDIAFSGSEEEPDTRLILFCIISISALVVVLCLLVPLFIRDNPSRGAFIQGVYRSNFAIVGISLSESMFGEEGVKTVAMVIPFAIILFNSFAVLIFSIFAPEEKKQKPLAVLKKILLNIVTNPLIIAVALALPFLLFKWTLPVPVHKGIQYLADLSLPLALMSIGSSFSFQSVKAKFGKTVVAASMKLIVVPVVMLGIAILLGFRGVALGIILILFGGRCAVSSYIMAKNMGSDYELTGHITLLTTMFCLITLFLGIFILKYTQLI